MLFILPKGGEDVNDENLRPCRNKSEARERGKIGGVASGKARREKKTIREAFALLKDLPLDNEKLREKLKKAGVTNDDMTYGAAMAIFLGKNYLGQSDRNETIISAGNPAPERLVFDFGGGENKAD